MVRAGGGAEAVEAVQKADLIATWPVDLAELDWSYVIALFQPVVARLKV